MNWKEIIMSEINFSINSLKDFQNNFLRNNNDILDELKTIQNEVVNLKEILDTPKSNELQKLFSEYTDEQIKVVEKYHQVINNNIERTILEYNSFIESIGQMVSKNE